MKFGPSTINGLVKTALSHVKDMVPTSAGIDFENFDIADFIGIQ